MKRGLCFALLAALLLFSGAAHSAVLAIGLVGYAAGYAIGATVGLAAIGGSIGFAIGSYIGQQLFAPDTNFQGPRLADLSATSSTLGSPIPIGYGTIRIKGNKIFQVKTLEVPHTEDVGGKNFGPSNTSTTYSYESPCVAFGFMDGPTDGLGIVGFRRLWLAKKLEYSVAEGATPQTFLANTRHGAITFYNGTETQLPDPTIEAHAGAGNVPGFRGHVYCVLANFQLADFSNVVPFAEAELVIGTPFTHPLVRHTISGVTHYKLAVDERRMRVVYVRQHPSPGDAIYIWDLTSTAPVEFAEFADNATNEPAVVVDVKNDQYHLLYSVASASDAIVYQSIDAVTGATVASGTLHINDFQPFYSLSGVVESGGVTNATGYWYDDNREVVWGVGLGFSSGEAFLLKIDVAARAVSATAISDSSVHAPQANTLVDADGGFWLVSSDHYVRAAPAPLVYDTGAAVVVVSAWLWKARQEIWVYPNSGGGTTGWKVFDLATRTEDDSVNIIAETLGYPAGVENSNGQAWFLKEGTTTGKLDGVLVNPDGTVAMTLVDFTDNPDGRGDTYVSLPGVIIRRHTNQHAQAFYEQSLAQGGVPLEDVVEDLCARAGVTAIDTTQLVGDTVRGFVVARPMTARNAIEPLQMAFGFDGTESDEVLKFVKRGGASVATIPAGDLGAVPDGASGEPPPLFKRARAMETELPVAIILRYINQTTDYDIAAETSRRLTTTAKNVLETELPIVLTSEEAAQLAENLQHQAWLERERLTFTLPPRYRWLDPTDVITMPDGGRVRLTRVTYGGDGILQCEAVGDDDGALTSYMTGAVDERTGEINISGRGVTVAAIMDCALLRDLDPDVVRYGGLCGEDSGWTGGILYQSRDDGASWTGATALSTPTRIGTVVDGLMTDAVRFGGWDHESELTVRLAQPDLALSSPASLEAFYQGANAFAITRDFQSYEIAQAYTVVANGDGTFTLRDWLRARKGTEYAAGPFGPGARIVALETGRLIPMPASLNELGETSYWKAVTSRGNLVDEVARARTFYGVAAKPLAPARVGGPKAASGDLVVGWTRRARIDGDWRSGGGQALDESVERYEVEIWDDGYGTLYHTEEVLQATSYTYTSALQTSEFGGSQNYVAARVYQISERVGRGFAGEGRVGTVPALLTFDPANTTGGYVLSNENRKITRTGNSISKACPTRGYGSGYWYWEFLVEGTVGNDVWLGMGNVTAGTSYWRWRGNGTVSVAGGPADLGLVTPAAGSTGVFMFAIDATNGKGWLGRNGYWNSGSDPAEGVRPHFTFTPASTWAPFVWSDNSTTSYTVLASFQFGNRYPVPAGFNLIR